MNIFRQNFEHFSFVAVCLLNLITGTSLGMVRFLEIGISSLNGRVDTIKSYAGVVTILDDRTLREAVFDNLTEIDFHVIIFILIII